ncbi:UNVERIFIED_CONTAM: peroxin [Siphonaria sp. JEL0065]|nr:peroxin [Siphonaria sp. JEL0065]
MTQNPKRNLVGRILIGTGVAIASGYVLYKYAMHKMEESSQKQVKERQARQNLRVRFEQNQKDATALTLKLVPVVSAQLFPVLGVEDITAALQKLRVNPEQLSPADAKIRKTELWETLKIASFTRTVAALYLINLLYVFSHIQLSIIGRYTYMSSVSSATHDLAIETERKFLTFSWYLLHKGLFECTARVKQAVEHVFAGVSISDDISCDELLAHVASIRSNVEEWSIDGSLLTFGFDSYLLPSVGQEVTTLKEASGRNDITFDETFLKYVNETRDFLEGPDFTLVFRKCLDKSFGVLESHIRTSLFTESVADQGERITEITSDGPTKIKLATSLPAMSRFASDVLQVDTENRVLNVLDAVPEVKALCTLIYTEWSSVTDS